MLGVAVLLTIVAVAGAIHAVERILKRRALKAVALCVLTVLAAALFITDGKWNEYINGPATTLIRGDKNVFQSAGEFIDTNSSENAVILTAPNEMFEQYGRYVLFVNLYSSQSLTKLSSVTLGEIDSLVETGVPVYLLAGNGSDLERADEFIGNFRWNAVLELLPIVGIYKLSSR